MGNHITGLTAGTIDLEWWPLANNCYNSMSVYRYIGESKLFKIENFYRPAQWFKIKTLLEQPDGWYLWVDSDARIENFNFDLPSIIEDGRFFYLSSDQNTVNTGVFLIKLNSITRKFLEKVYSSTSFIGAKYEENSAIHHLLEINHENCRSWTRILRSSEFNCYSAGEFSELSWYTSEKKPFVYHLPGQEISTRHSKLLPYYIHNFRENISNIKQMDSVVEIGVCRGEFAINKLLCISKNLTLIDPWKNYSKYIDIENKPQELQDNDYNLVKSLFRNEPSVKILRDTSLKAAEQFSEGSIDMCYIDGNHSYEYALNDIEVWWPKIKKGGMLCGHDYQDSFDGITDIKVKSAVNRWFSKNPQRIGFISNEPSFKSWVIIKE